MIDEIAKMGVPFVYYYGMYGIDKIAKPVYDKLISINNSNSNLKLKFVHTQRVHTKMLFVLQKSLNWRMHLLDQQIVQ